jgi:hypothetical protein
MSDKNKRKKKEYEVKKGSSKTPVTKKSVKDAKAKKGVFKERSAYKGKVVRDEKGNMAGVKTHSGKFIRTKDPVERHKAKQVLKKDRKYHKSDSISHSKRIKRFQSAKKY